MKKWLLKFPQKNTTRILLNFIFQFFKKKLPFSWNSTRTHFIKIVYIFMSTYPYPELLSMSKYHDTVLLSGNQQWFLVKWTTKEEWTSELSRVYVWGEQQFNISAGRREKNIINLTVHNNNTGFLLCCNRHSWNINTIWK